MTELLSPAGNWSCLRAAVKGGCDSVYFGLQDWNMRASGRNFEFRDLKKIAEFCRFNNIKCYLCLNSIVYDSELAGIEKIVKKAKEVGVDAVVCWDFGVLNLCRKYRIKVHLSTQASCANVSSLKEYKKLGFSRVILARELNLKQIKKICDAKVMDVEIFVHGAMCYSVSGRCFFSQELYNVSANRGRCIQPCRRKYLLTDVETGKEIEADNQHFLSAKDLCCMPFLDKIIATGVKAVKIEGRNKTADYVYEVTRAYREAVDAINNGVFDKFKDELMKRLNEVYNRKFSSGFYLGLPTPEDITDIYGSAGKKKVEIGRVLNYLPNRKVMIVRLTKSLKAGDEIYVIGKTTGIVKLKTGRMEINYKRVESASKCDVAVEVGERVRKGDSVYAVR